MKYIMKKFDFKKVESVLREAFIKAAKAHGSMRDVFKGDMKETVKRLGNKVGYNPEKAKKVANSDK